MYSSNGGSGKQSTVYSNSSGGNQSTVYPNSSGSTQSTGNNQTTVYPNYSGSNHTLPPSSNTSNGSDQKVFTSSVQNPFTFYSGSGKRNQRIEQPEPIMCSNGCTIM